MAPTARELANHEVVTIAVYLLHGDVSAVDTEDIAMKANEIAPGRFSWRKYPEQVNFESVRRRLTTAADDYDYLVGSHKDGWRLTELGRQFADEAIPRADVVERRAPLSLRERQWRSRERERILMSDAYRAYVSGHLDEPSQRDAERFFRIDEHFGQEARRARIERTLIHFGQDEELGPLTRLMANLLGEETGNE